MLMLSHGRFTSALLVILRPRLGRIRPCFMVVGSGWKAGAQKAKAMLFNSVEFLFFLPIVFFLYWFVCDRWIGRSKYQLTIQNMLIVIASYVFYGWWDWRFLILIAFTTLCSFLSGIGIERYAKRQKLILWANIILNLGILALFKYYDFFVGEFAQLFGLQSDALLLNLILPVGISFYTFQALSYSIDVYRGSMRATHDTVAFFAYVSFFPQLVAGPIERATNLLPQFQQKRSFDYATAVDGMRQILWGLFKKVVIADNCATYVDQVWATYPTQSGSTLLVAAILFAFQIYGDFSGYSDIAIGTSKLFGIRLMRNFNVPYFSRDIAEFWRRWHISLTTWFRDYVYIPLGGSRCSKAKVVRNTFIIFLLSGFWHGANWTFILWGAFHALLFLPLILLGKNRKHTDVVAEGRFLPSVREFGQMLLTFVLVVFGWIIFRAPGIPSLVHYLQTMCSASIFTMPYIIKSDSSIRLLLLLIVMAVMEWIGRSNEHALSFLKGKPKTLQLVIYYAILVAIFLFTGENQTFIYFQF